MSNSNYNKIRKLKSVKKNQEFNTESSYEKKSNVHTVNDSHNHQRKNIERQRVKDYNYITQNSKVNKYLNKITYVEQIKDVAHSDVQLNSIEFREIENSEKKVRKLKSHSMVNLEKIYKNGYKEIKENGFLESSSSDEEEDGSFKYLQYINAFSSFDDLSEYEVEKIDIDKKIADLEAKYSLDDSEKDIFENKNKSLTRKSESFGFDVLEQIERLEGKITRLSDDIQPTITQEKEPITSKTDEGPWETAILNEMSSLEKQFDLELRERLAKYEESEKPKILEDVILRNDNKNVQEEVIESFPEVLYLEIDKNGKEIFIDQDDDILEISLKSLEDERILEQDKEIIELSSRTLETIVPTLVPEKVISNNSKVENIEESITPEVDSDAMFDSPSNFDLPLNPNSALLGTLNLIKSKVKTIKEKDKSQTEKPLHICLISEGCYPYVVGGVSSWIHSLIKSMPQYNFTILSINTDSKDRGNFKYEMHDNVIEVREHFFSDYFQAKGDNSLKLKDVGNVYLEFSKLLSDVNTNWDEIFQFINKNPKCTPQDFLLSKPFFDLVIETYNNNYDKSSLNEYLWTVRSMILPLLSVMMIDLPDVDIFHSASTGYAGILATSAKIKKNKPVLITEHGIYTREREEEVITADWVKPYFKDFWISFFSALSNCAYKYTDLSITLFQHARELQEDLGCVKEKQLVIANGVDVDRFMKIERSNLDVKNPVIGAIVRVVPIKDIITMLQAFRLVHVHNPNARFLIMGPKEENPEYYEECLQVSKLLEINDVVEFTGRINILDYLPKIDLLVLSSISEGQPLSVLEGLAAGVPYVTTNVGSCHEIIYGVDDGLGDAGAVVPIMDFKGISQAIIRIITDPELLLSMRYAGEQRVNKFFRKEFVINNYVSLYEDLSREN